MTDNRSLLLEAGANVNSVTNDGWIPLKNAVTQGHLAATRLLLASGTNVKADDTDGFTPWHRLAMSTGSGIRSNR